MLGHDGPRRETHLYPFRTSPMAGFFISYRGMELVFYSYVIRPTRIKQAINGAAHDGNSALAANNHCDYHHRNLITTSIGR